MTRAARRRRRTLAAALVAATTVVTGAGAETAAAGVRNGRLVFASGQNLALQPMSGRPDVVRQRPAAIVGSSRSGRLIATSSGVDGDVTISDAHGRAKRRMNFRGIVIHSLDVSPDGRRIALTAFRDAEPGRLNVFPYVVGIDGKGLARLRTGLPHAFDLRFTRDGDALVYAGAPADGPFAPCPSLRRVRLDGTRDTLLYAAAGGRLPCVVNVTMAPTGPFAAFTGDPAPGTAAPPGASVRTGVYRVQLIGNGVPTLLAADAFAPAWAPAGDQVAYSTTTGTFRLPAGGGTRTFVTTTPALSLTWLRAVS